MVSPLMYIIKKISEGHHNYLYGNMARGLQEFFKYTVYDKFCSGNYAGHGIVPKMKFLTVLTHCVQQMLIKLSIP